MKRVTHAGVDYYYFKARKHLSVTSADQVNNYVIRPGEYFAYSADMKIALILTEEELIKKLNVEVSNL